jgi:hypothetical protein
MSAISLTLGPSTTAYDFTAGQSQAYGTQPMNLLESGVYGMVAGDANRSGIITAADANNVFGTLNVAGYNFNDINLTGIVTAADANSVYSNLNRATGVPGEAPAIRSENSREKRGNSSIGTK